MGSCFNCKYGANKGNVYIICKYFNKVINTKHFNGCSSYKSKNIKMGYSKNCMNEK